MRSCLHGTHTPLTLVLMRIRSGNTAIVPELARCEAHASFNGPVDRDATKAACRI
jgi:hypothetical protein